jgi:hypothetical protein
MIPKLVRYLPVAGLFIAASIPPAMAAPAAVDQGLDANSDMASEPPATAPARLSDWVDSEVKERILREQLEQVHRALAGQPFVPYPPTWIQGAAIVNPGDFPSLDGSAEAAERELRTIEWLLENREQQARQAREQAGRPGTQTDQGSTTLQDWVKLLLPSHWMPILKEHRVWVLGGAGAVLIASWFLSAFARPSTRGSRSSSSGTKPAGSMREFQAPGSRTSSSSSSASAVLDESSYLRRRRRRSRR